MAVTYSVEILDNQLNYLATIRNLAAITTKGSGSLSRGTMKSPSVPHFLDFSHALSGIGKCTFRVATKDPFFAQVGDIVQPYRNHVRVKRNGVVVWQGVIARNPSRNPFFVDIEARTYLWLLDKVLIRHDAPDGNGAENYWTIKSGTLASNITQMLNYAKADMGFPLQAMTIGEIDNPNFPASFTDDAGNPLSGPWTFSNNFQIKFDYRTPFYVLRMFGAYANFDFEVTDQMVVNFKSFIGNKQPELVFKYHKSGPETNNLTSYNAPRDGDKMVNDLYGIAANTNYQVIHSEQSDQPSIAQYGKIMGVAAFSDVKAVNLLNTRLIQELNLMKQPDAELQLIPNERAVPFGQYMSGDTVTADIQDGPLISVNEPRRIVGVDVKVQDTGYEDINVITNRPRFDQQ